MITKTAHHTFLHKYGTRTTDVKMVNLLMDNTNWKKVFKFTYDTYNSVERFNGEIFNGEGLSLIFTIRDLGVAENSDAYLLLNEIKIKERIEMLTKKGIEFINLLY
jgi:hypothetical protein